MSYTYIIAGTQNFQEDQNVLSDGDSVGYILTPVRKCGCKRFRAEHLLARKLSSFRLVRLSNYKKEDSKVTLINEPDVFISGIFNLKTSSISCHHTLMYKLWKRSKKVQNKSIVYFSCLNPEKISKNTWKWIFSARVRLTYMYYEFANRLAIIPRLLLKYFLQSKRRNPQFSIKQFTVKKRPFNLQKRKTRFAVCPLCRAEAAF